jgi:hypothetical protein
MFNTRNGYIGLCSQHLEVGDLVCCFFGGRKPFIVRRGARKVAVSTDTASKTQGHKLVDGDAYVEGLGWDGAGIAICEKKGLQPEDICLI